MYVRMRAQNKVDPYRSEVALLNIVFNTFIGKMEIAFSMSSSELRFVEVGEHGNTIRPDFANHPDLLGDINLLFHIFKDV